MILKLAIPLRTGLIRPPRANVSLGGTTLTEGEPSWLDVVEVMDERFQGYLALLLLDESKSSKSLARIIRERYFDLDRLTGEHLLLMSTVEPPESWFRHKIEEYKDAPDWAQDYIRNELTALRTELGKNRAKLNSQRLINEFFDFNHPLPALCFLQPRPDSAGINASTVDAEAVDMSGIQSESSVFSAFRYLRSLAEKRRLLGQDAVDVAREAGSWALTSLRWRSAVLKTLDIYRFAEMFTGRARKILSGG